LVVDLAKDYSMRRFQLSSVLFLVAIVALACALFIQQRRAALRERQLRAELAEMSARSDMLEIMGQLHRLESENLRSQPAHRAPPAGVSADEQSAQAQNSDPR
jgi:hypothetical protein